MRFVSTAISGAFIVEVDSRRDDRGTFARTFCAETFARHGLVTTYPQCNISQNHKRGTLRGMHYQADPKPETKLVRATRGRVFDVAIDLRPNSATYLRSAATELDAARQNAFYIPAGCAHGFLTLEDDCELYYQMSDAYAPELARGVVWNDPQFAIDWPFSPIVISDRDATLDCFSPESQH